MSYIPTEVSNLVKDTESGALLNTDKNALQAYKMRRKNASRINTIESDVADVKEELSEIRSLLLQLVNR
jgi:hypothetical protein